MASVLSADLVGMSAIGIARLVARREVSAEEVVRRHLDRIDELDPAIGAFVHVRRDEALAEARRLDADPEARRLPLAGVPVAVKDNVDVAGEPTRYGSAAHSRAAVADDEPMVRRLRAAGAVPLGKTNMPELAAWGFTEPIAFGPTRNPWDPARTPGGSSGGSAAAVASAMAPLAVASDGGGSIRIPAACCGVFGVKPGPGFVPVSAKLAEHWLGMTRWGPIAYTVDDAALALQVMAGSREPNGTETRPLHVAVSLRAPDFAAQVDPDVREAVLETGRLLEMLGHHVEAADPPYPPGINVRWGLRWMAGIAKDAAALERSRLEPKTRALAAIGSQLWRSGLARPAETDSFHRAGRRWLSRYDVAVTAVTSSPAVEIGHWSRSNWLRAALGQSAWVWTLPWSVARVPAASVPARMSVDGLPVGVQLVVNPGHEAVLLQAARELESVRGWRRPPVVS